MSDNMPLKLTLTIFMSKWKNKWGKERSGRSGRRGRDILYIP
jgi:hypothetical protein